MSLLVSPKPFIAYMDGKNTNPAYLQGKVIQKNVKHPLPIAQCVMVACLKDPFGVAPDLKNLAADTAKMKAWVNGPMGELLKDETRAFFLQLVKETEKYNATAKA